MIRTFQPGDEAEQVRIYNAAAATALPKFKPATLDELRRRVRASEFDPTARFLAVAEGRAVGYAGFHANGRVSYPWCLPGQEAWAGPLFEHVLCAMAERGLTRAFAAYRGDWRAQLEFFRSQGFQQAREMVNFVLELRDMPTPAARRGVAMTPLRPDDLPAVVQLGTGVLRTTEPEALKRQLFENPYFPGEAMFALRNPEDGRPRAVGVLITNPAYANPQEIDAAMPCFRLGAFGTEGMQTKRINGLFSFLAGEDEATRLGTEILSYAAMRTRQNTVEAFAAQVPSDAPHLLRFYQHIFRRQASFPVLERSLAAACTDKAQAAMWRGRA
jgi:hypothetical protein